MPHSGIRTTQHRFSPMTWIVGAGRRFLVLARRLTIVVAAMVCFAACAAWPFSYSRMRNVTVSHLNPAILTEGQFDLGINSGRVSIRYAWSPYKPTAPWIEAGYRGRRVRYIVRAAEPSNVAWDYGIRAETLVDLGTYSKALIVEAFGAQFTRHTMWYSQSLRRSGVDLIVPCYLVVLASAVPPAFALRRLHRRRRQTHRSGRGQCTACGYDLRGSPGRCPECGRERPAAPRDSDAGTSTTALVTGG